MNYRACELHLSTAITKKKKKKKEIEVFLENRSCGNLLPVDSHLKLLNRLFRQKEMITDRSTAETQEGMKGKELVKMWLNLNEH